MGLNPQGVSLRGTHWTTQQTAGKTEMQISTTQKEPNTNRVTGNFRSVIYTHRPYSPSVFTSILTIHIHHSYPPSILTVHTHYPHSPSILTIHTDSPNSPSILTLYTPHPYPSSILWGLFAVFQLFCPACTLFITGSYTATLCILTVAWLSCVVLRLSDFPLLHFCCYRTLYTGFSPTCAYHRSSDK